MKAQIKFVRLDEEETLGEPELVFLVIPNTGDGVYTKNKWYCRVAKCFVDETGGGSKELNKQIEKSKELIGAIMEIDDNPE